MSNDANQEVVISFTTQGASNSEQIMKRLERLFGDLQKSGSISEKQHDQFFKTIARGGRDAAQGVKQSTQAIEAQGKALQSAEDKYKNFSNVQRDFNSAQSTRLNILKNINDTTSRGVIVGEQANKKMEALRKSTDTYTNNLPRLRYALYDVSSTLTFAGIAMAGLATATVATSITMDRQFADVVRTTGTYLDSTGQAAANLRGEFNSLYSSIPTSWADLTQIGTLAGQLGVATENVSEFSSLVAKFSAVTDVTVDASATAFGRLSELLNVSAAEYENLGSSIAAAGVSSVATESQIIAISSQIASMGAFVGMSADEVIGLSSALASLGVQPELSRGTLTRLFTNVTNAIAEGGEKLERFGSIAKMSGADFATAWGNNASDALYQLLDGLGQVEDSQAVAVLNSVGITAARDVPTILKLAQNTELLGEQLQIASDGYAQGTALQEQYGVIAETVASKLEVLKNNFSLLVSSLGGASSALGPVIDFVNELLQGLTAFISHPAGQFIAVLTVGLTGLAGIIALVVGAAARGAAGLAAMITALNDMAVSGGGATLSMNSLQAALVRTGVSANVAAAGFKAIKYALISTGIGAAIVAVGSAIAYFVSKADEANGATQRLSDAISADTKAGRGVKLATDYTVNYGRATEGVAITQEAWNKILDGSSTYSEEYAKAVDTATEAVENFQAVAGEGTRAEILDIFQESDAIKDAFEGGLLPENLDFSELTDILIKEGQAGADAYLSELFNVEEIKSRRVELLKAIQDDPLITEGMAFQAPETWAANRLTEDQMDLLAAFKVSSESLTDYNSVLDAVNSTQEQMTGAVENAAYAQRILAGESEEAAKSTYDAGDAAYDAAFGYDEAAGSVQDYVDSIFGALNTNSNLAGSLYDLGQSIYENGQNFDVFSASGRANMEALQEVFSATAEWAAQNGVTFEDAMAQVGGAMVQAGVVSVEQLQALGVAGVNFGNDLLSVAEATSQAVAALQSQMASLQAQQDSGSLTAGQAADGMRYAGQAMALIEANGPGAAKAMESMGLKFDRLEASGLDINDLLGSITQGWDDAGDAANKSGSKQSKAAKEVEKEVRTLADYVSDLSSVFSDAFDFRFGLQQSKDAVAEATQAMRDRFEGIRESISGFQQDIRDSRAEIRGLKAELLGLQSDRSILQYRLSIANEYGDDKRAAAIRAELAKNAAETAETQNELKDAQEDVSKSTGELKKAQEDLVPDLTSNTESSREQRETVEGLVGAYQDQIVELANSGLSQKDLERKTETLNADFREQLTQMGYNKEEVKEYGAAFDDFAEIIREVPRDLTVKANADTSPAKKALDIFTSTRRSTTVGSKANTSGAKKTLDNFARNYGGTATIKARVDDRDIDAAANKQYYLAKVWEANRALQNYGGPNPGPLIADVNYWRNKVNSVKDYWVGGFTGRGGKYDAAGVVHRGEYVVPKEGVNQATGLPYADYFSRLTRGVPSPAGYANGGHVQSRPFPGMVSLTPATIQQLAAAIPQVLMMNGQIVGQVTSQEYANSTRRGSN